MRSAVVAFALGLFLTPAARRFGIEAGLVDRPGDPALAIHTRPVPVVGGAAVLLATFGAVAITRGHLPWSVVTAVALALLTGLADDVTPLPAWLRLLVLAVAGALLAVGGLRVEALGPLGATGVVVLTVSAANAANILDGQNGLLGGVAAIGALSLAGLWGSGLSARASGPALAAALAAFLIWNMRGAIFLGNGGAYGVGTLLAVLAADASRRGWSTLAGAALCLGPFLFEVVFTFARRAATGAAIATGDRLHSYDLVAGRGAGRTRSTVMFWMLAGASAGIGIGVSRLGTPLAFSVIAAAGVVAAAGGLHLWRRSASARAI